tara:strand:+ start:49 stop:525 length:477 start_codon:yes stop_codon:yes gene_type:complete
MGKCEYCEGVVKTKKAQMDWTNHSRCEQCNGTGDAYWSDGMYGPCDCAYPVGPWFICDVCDDCGTTEINQSRERSSRRVRAHLRLMIIKKDTKIMNRLESLFSSGMGWGNRKEWHIDHIRPIKSFLDNNITDCDIINHHLNLQPLWAKDNFAKAAKYE